MEYNHKNILDWSFKYQKMINCRKPSFLNYFLVLEIIIIIFCRLYDSLISIMSFDPSIESSII